MPSKSESQRKLFGLALCYKRGDCKDVSDEVKDIANKMSIEDIADFARKPKKKYESEQITEHLIKDYWSFINEEDMDDIDYYLYDLRDQMLYDTLLSVRDSKPNDRQKWTVIPFGILKNTWESYMKYGFVRNEKILDEIGTIVIKNILQLDINTELCGHKTYLPTDEMEDCGVTEEMLEETDYFLDDKAGQWRISDFAMDKLNILAFKIAKEKNAEKKLVLIDQVLNTVHMRSDIASWFVQGGSKSLSELSGTLEYNNN